MGNEVQSGIARREFLRRTTALGVGLSLPSGLLAACGGDGASSSGGVLSVGATDWLPPDFFIENSLGAHLIGYSQIAWALFMGGGGDGKGWEFRHGLASSYEVSEDGLTHTVSVRDGITFHDGSPIDAEAVAANLRGSFFKDDPLHRGSATYIQISITLGDPPIVRGVEVADERTVRIVLEEFRADIRNALALTMILNPRILRRKDYGTDVKALAEGGSGPFRLTRFQAGDFAEFVPYEDFFEKVVPERVRLQQVGDAGALALALQSGDVAVASGLAKADFDRLARSDFNPVVARPSVNVDLIFGHPEDPAFADPRVRRAVGLAMNRKAYAERFFSTGTAQESSQPIVAPGMSGFVDGLEPVPHDPAAARALLAAAGVRSAKLTLDAATAAAPISSTKGLLEAIAQDLSEIGIQATVRILDGAANGTLIEEGRTGAYLQGPGGGVDPFILFDLYCNPPYAPAELRRYPAITKDLAEAHATRDVGERDRLLGRIVRAMNDEALMVPIAVASYSAMAASAVEHFPLSCTQLDSWNTASVS